MNVTLDARRAMFGNNTLKLGLFSSNASNGRFPTTVPERWSGNWADNLELAQMADGYGLDFLLPIGRWKGYGGETDHQGTTLETITWASALLAKTERITIFATVHTPLFHPVIAAKQMVTADHVGEGRFGLNVVCGSNEDEFEMLGLELRDHDKRYEYGQDWLDAVKLMWEREEPFDFVTQYFNLKKVSAKPKPYGGSRPIIMNAGASAVGRSYAIRNCDAYFTGVRLAANDAAGRFVPAIDDAAEQVRGIQALSKQMGREVGVYTRGEVVCRPTEREADEYYHYAVEEHADWGAVDHRLRKAAASESPEDFKRRRFNHIHGFPIVGTPDDVAETLAKVSAAGFEGLAIGMINYLDELPFFCEEVLPRLERLGVRAPTPKTANA
jgi:alkanesulfonate monooxygenase SsuD/methylene tetrahydromethanopterin reductase-like flavin-dependent oxidoreductase (luciferase family)